MTIFVRFTNFNIKGVFMKKIQVIFTLIILFGSVTACDYLIFENNQASNSFTYDGDTHNIEFANLEDYEDEASPYNLGLYLVGPGLTFDHDTADFSGTGDIIILDLYTSMVDGLTSETYTWSAERNIETISSAEMYLNYNTADNSYDSDIKAGNASVTVSRSGDIYTINFTMSNESDLEIVSGSYEGTLPLWTD